MSILHIAFSNGVHTFITLLASFIVARLLGPVGMGHLGTARLIGLYLGPLHLGAPQGMGQQVPILRGAGQNEEAERLRSAVFALASVLSLAGVALAAIAFFIGLSIGEALVSWVLGGGILIFVFNLHSQYLTLALGNDKKFKAISLKTLGASLATLFTLPIVLWGFEAAIVRVWLISLCEVLVGVVVGRLVLHGRLNGATLKNAVRIGLPIFCLGFLQQYATVLDRTLVRVLMGSEALGIYTIASVVAGASIALPQAIVRVLYPSIGELYGATGNARVAARAVLKPMPILFAMAAVILTVGSLVVPPLVARFLPAYAAGIPSARLAVVCCAMALFAYGTFFFHLIRRVRYIFGALLAGLSLQVLVSIVLFKSGMDLLSFMAGTLIGAGFFTIVLNAAILLIAAGRIRVPDERKSRPEVE